MAAKLYRQDYVDGTSEMMRRTTPQGRKPIPVELKMVRTNITMSRKAKEIIRQKRN